VIGPWLSVLRNRNAEAARGVSALRAVLLVEDSFGTTEAVPFQNMASA
jgi:hypothetical protein